MRVHRQKKDTTPAPPSSTPEQTTLELPDQQTFRCAVCLCPTDHLSSHSLQDQRGSCRDVVGLADYGAAVCAVPSHFGSDYRRKPAGSCPWWGVLHFLLPADASGVASHRIACSVGLHQRRDFWGRCGCNVWSCSQRTVAEQPYWLGAVDRRSLRSAGIAYSQSGAPGGGGCSPQKSEPKSKAGAAVLAEGKSEHGHRARGRKALTNPP